MLIQEKYAARNHHHPEERERDGVTERREREREIQEDAEVSERETNLHSLYINRRRREQRKKVFF